PIALIVGHGNTLARRPPPLPTIDTPGSPGAALLGRSSRAAVEPEAGCGVTPTCVGKVRSAVCARFQHGAGELAKAVCKNFGTTAEVELSQSGLRFIVPLTRRVASAIHLFDVSVDSDRCVYHEADNLPFGGAISGFAVDLA